MIEDRTVKRRRLSPPSEDRLKDFSPEEDLSEDGDQQAKDLLAFASHWNLEQNYENRPRKKRKDDRESTRLPIKTAQGLVQQSQLPEVADGEESDDSAALLGEEEQEEIDAAHHAPPEVSKLPVRQQILEAKEELARIATMLNEDPEENAGAFRTLLHFSYSHNPTIKKLALVTQLSVYKDVIPGYRIRPLGEDDPNARISKDVRRLRNFEQALVGSYQGYIRLLTSLSKGLKGSKGVSAEEARGLSTVAKSCACALVVAVPHFNFRGELLKILVDQLSGRKLNDDFVKCRGTLETLFREDENGAPSLDAVGLLTRMIKGRNYNVDESVLNTFLHLRLLSDFSSKGSQNRIDNARDGQNGKKPKQKREFRTKKQRKLVKENKVIEKEFREADAAVGHEERDRMQAETLKLVFVCYFRVLKSRAPGLMGAVLEGLAKYAHLINQDFFVDLLEALKDLIGRAEEADEASDNEALDDPETQSRSGRNPTREALLCIITAFALLQGQNTNSTSTNARVLNLDLNFFITHLYRTLFPLSINPDIELSRKSLHLPDPSSQNNPTAISNKVNIQTTTILLLRSLSSVLLPAPNTPVSAIPPLRVAAFTKQLMTASLHLPERSCLAMLNLLTKVAKTHRRKVAALWNTEERKGDGVFDALRADLEGSNPYASNVWEGELLRCHFCPDVREGVKALEGGLVEQT
ncbi:MAG: hypothetical protein M4579_000577 [Chaenotheca gracillima]|nr:MAG: hypothetical protein M4579_000577 [Chaenotheca gracillima]